MGQGETCKVKIRSHFKSKNLFCHIFKQNGFIELWHPVRAGSFTT